MGTLALWLKRVSYYEREVWQSSSTMITTEGDEDEQVASDEPALATRSELLGRWWKDWRTLVAAVVFSLTALYVSLSFLYRTPRGLTSRGFVSSSVLPIVSFEVARTSVTTGFIGRQ